MKKDRLEAESRREAENAVMKLYAGFARSMVPPPHFDIITAALLRAKKRERARTVREVVAFVEKNTDIRNFPYAWFRKNILSLTKTNTPRKKEKSR